MAQTTHQEEGINGVIKKISSADFTFSQLTPEEFAPIGGDAYVVATKKEEGKDKRRLKITQLRKLFAEIKRLEQEVKGKRDDEPLTEEFYNKLWLLQPELAYARGRDLVDKSFFELMRVSLSENKLKTVGDFRRFAQFLTAIVAYSKYVKEE